MTRHPYLDWRVDVPEYDHDGVVIERFEISEAAATFEQLRAAFNPQRSDRAPVAGTFTRLVVDGVIWMSDTPAECADLADADAFLRAGAGGTALIVGLGMGVVVNRAIEHGLRFVHVLERDGRVIDAVVPHYRAKAKERGVLLAVEQADVHEWRSVPGQRWDIVYIDIWAEISMDDLAEDERLRKRFQPKANRWYGAWCHAERLAQRRRIATGTGFY